MYGDSHVSKFPWYYAEKILQFGSPEYGPKCSHAAVGPHGPHKYGRLASLIDRPGNIFCRRKIAPLLWQQLCNSTTRWCESLKDHIIVRRNR
jgi:hypothetical protein